MKTLETFLLSCLLNSLWQVPLVVAVGWAAALMVRRMGPEAEHRVWASGLMLAGILPVASGLPWEWIRIPLAWSIAHPYGEARVSVVMGPGTGLGAVPLPSALLAGVAAAYALLSAWFAARFLWRWWRLLAVCSDAQEAVLSGDAALFWNQCRSRFGADEVSLASSPRVVGPVTLGVRHTLILLPTGMLEAVTLDDLRAVLAHEFAHIRRQDFLTNLIYECLALPVTYHPVFRIARRRMMETREMICDQMAAAAIEGRNQYARSLLRLARRLSGNRPATTHYAIGISDANTFERRIMKLTEKRTEVRGVLRVAGIGACIAFGAATCMSALALRVGVSGLAGDHDTKPNGPVNVAPGVMQAQKISGPNPVYPPDAKKARIQGTVVLEAIIGADGTVEHLTVTSGPSALQQSSLDAVRQWTYKPFLLNSEPVEVKTTINVIYTLAK